MVTLSPFTGGVLPHDPTPWGFLPHGVGPLVPGVRQNTSLAVISEITPPQTYEVENKESSLVKTCKMSKARYDIWAGKAGSVG